ncbi:hypothetical protein GCM10010145_19850 [Streptomyces ruber]|uniref:Uncharacterized protein n=2 Tax=Streptomyces TaxID=1883 RepID=A0A918EPI4_9ACTN|nr:hypothetical protein [Streptomyces ruber]GGQ50787.1 hypothetical protein GCM10010145_19850 [Streptomyces ruber]
MLLARGTGDGFGAWWWAMGAVAMYAVISYGLQYRARRRRGSLEPARDALHDLKDREDPQPPGKRVASRVIMFCGAAAAGLVAWATSGAVRPVAAAATALAAAVLWAYYDHRTQDRAARR